VIIVCRNNWFIKKFIHLRLDRPTKLYGLSKTRHWSNKRIHSDYTKAARHLSNASQLIAGDGEWQRVEETTTCSLDKRTTSVCITKYSSTEELHSSTRLIIYQLRTSGERQLVCFSRQRFDKRYDDATKKNLLPSMSPLQGRTVRCERPASIGGFKGGGQRGHAPPPTYAAGSATAGEPSSSMKHIVGEMSADWADLSVFELAQELVWRTDQRTASSADHVNAITFTPFAVDDGLLEHTSQFRALYASDSSAGTHHITGWPKLSRISSKVLISFV
jgi:hypothetical protein